MTEAKFTKGPWVLIDGQFSSEVEITTENRQENSKGKICEMDIYFGGEHGIEQPANAHLIASAPEMYEMLKKMQAVMYHLSNEQGLIDSKRDACRDDFSTINGLLAKARGE